uniref:tRNA(Ile)-lysidine/2-thiocytidine synthase N-terminal domain-containing protein n=1 Tax=Ascaris lumbricoides TaxID=6252 RepID=A0A9J2QCJ6_ASCLU
MPEYQLNCESGEWHHYRQRVFHSRKWLGFVTFTNRGIRVRNRGTPNSCSENAPSLDDLFIEAERLALDGINSKIRVPDGRNVLDEETEKLRWFLMGSEVSEMQSGIKPSFPLCPFSPKKYVHTAKDEEYVEDRSNLLKETFADHVVEANEETSVCIDEEADDAPACFECNGKEGEGIVCPISEGREELTTCCFSGVDEGDTIDDWNRRVVVTQQDDISEEEKMRQPWVIPPLELYKSATEAIHSLNMIQDGDRVLVCLSGGKDSLSLLHILHHYQQRAMLRRKNRFRLGAITVDPGSTAYNPRPLIEYCRSLNIDYFYEEQNIIGQAGRLSKCRSICAFCSRMKRGRLAAAAKLHGYNVLAMGHHLDDLAESFLIAAFQNGNLSTMKAVYITRDGALRVIRPLIYVREKALREFAESNKLPIIAENCPACFEKPKERYRMKQLLATHELIFPQLFSSLRSALHPLLLVDSPVTSGMRKLAIENIKCKNGINDFILTTKITHFYSDANFIIFDNFRIDTTLPVYCWAGSMRHYGSTVGQYRMKQLLATHELIFPQLFSSLRSALHPLLLVDSPITSGMRKLAIENIVREMQERNQRLHSHNQNHPLL